ncbi:MAG: hypothetical protein FJX72_07590, partial [Armatimonadetes bacterium]|nr:hypothetical protein [Armatimonadota bacterium]
MRLNQITRQVGLIPDMPRLLRFLQTESGHARLDGITGVAKSLLIAALAERVRAPMLVISHQQDQVDRLCDDLRQFWSEPDRVFPLPALERDAVLRSAVDYVALGERMSALEALASSLPCIVVATPEGVFQHVGPPRETLAARIVIGVSEQNGPDGLMRRLTAIGYTRTTTVAQPGQFARRGGILDIFPVGSEHPVRLEMMGDEIESLRSFDAGTQRSSGNLSSVGILPVHPLLITSERAARAEPPIRAALEASLAALLGAGRRAEAQALEDRVGGDLAMLAQGEYFDHVNDYMPFLAPENLSALDYLGAEDGSHAQRLLVLDEPSQMERHWFRVEEDRSNTRARLAEHGEALIGAAPEASARRVESSLDRLAAHANVLQMSSLGGEWPRAKARLVSVVRSAAMESFRSRADFLQAETSRWLDQGALCVVVTDQPHRTREVLADLSVPMAPLDGPVGIDETDGTDQTDAAAGRRVAGGTPALQGSRAGIVIIEGRLRQGIKFDEARLYVVTDQELYGSARPPALRRRASGGAPISTLLDLRENDF